MTASAFAQSVQEQAEALFRQGKALMGQQKFAEACAAFESSHKLEPDISTLINHANCREKNAELATAWRLFADAERQTHGKPDGTSKQLNAVAAARAGKLKARLSMLSINVAPESRLADLEVLRDADRVAPDVWNQPVPIDGGTYKITARTPGHAEWSTTVVVKPEGDVQVVAIPKLDPLTAAEPKQDDRPPAPTDTTPTTDPPTNTMPTSAVTAPMPIEQGAPRPMNPPKGEGSAKRSLALPIVMGSAALVLGGSAFAFSRWGDSTYNDAEREPDDAKQEALWRSANKRRYAAEGLAVGAVGCVGTAIYLYIRGGSEPARPVARGAIRIEPTASANTIGLRSVW